MNLFGLHDVPDGYITGLPRDENADKKVAHLYEGTFGDVGNPMCRRGWNRSDGEGYSIFRNNVGEKGICKVCMRRAKLGLKSVGAKENPQKYNYYW